MRASKLTTGVLGILFIGTMTAGCGESRKQTIAKCAVETQRLYRDYSFLHDHPNSFMRRCMEAAGYEYTCSNAFGDRIRPMLSHGARGVVAAEFQVTA